MGAVAMVRELQKQSFSESGACGAKLEIAWSFQLIVVIVILGLGNLPVPAGSESGCYTCTRSISDPHRSSFSSCFLIFWSLIWCTPVIKMSTILCCRYRHHHLLLNQRSLKRYYQ